MRAIKARILQAAAEESEELLDTDEFNDYDTELDDSETTESFGSQVTVSSDSLQELQAHELSKRDATVTVGADDDSVDSALTAVDNGLPDENSLSATDNSLPTDADSMPSAEDGADKAADGAEEKSAQGGGLRQTLSIVACELLMIVGAYLTYRLVTPMGWSDHYSILLNLGIICFLATGLTLSIVDMATKTLPTRIIYWGGGTSLLLFVAAVAVRGESWPLLLPMIFGGLFYFLFFFLIWFLQPRAFGFGDVRLSFFIGAILAFLSLESAVVGLAAPWLLAVAGICVAAVFGKINGKTQIAFGPWMILGAFVGLFWGSPIVNMMTIG